MDLFGQVTQALTHALTFYDINLRAFFYVGRYLLEIPTYLTHIYLFSFFIFYAQNNFVPGVVVCYWFLIFLFSNISGCEVHPFGSIVTGLGIRSSDVDVYVRISNKHKLSPVILARNKLRSTPWKFTNIFAIPAANVPIVKFTHVPTGCNCDVNFQSEAGVTNSKLIFNLLKTESKALSLAIIIKYWSKVFKLTGTNLLSSYALTMLVIFYLQAINMLAPVSDIQKYEDPHIVESWNCAFDKNAHQPKAYRDNGYHLLGGFFKYYSFFRFEQYVVSPFLGIPVMRSIFGSSDNNLPKEFSLYKENLKAKVCNPLRIHSPMCIQDPFNHSRNCAVAVSQRLFAKLQMHFQYAARMYDVMPPDDFLKAVFTQESRYTPAATHSPHVHVVQTIFKSKKQKKKKKMNKTVKKYIEVQNIR